MKVFLASDGEQDMAPENMPREHSDCCELKGLEKQLVQEGHSDPHKPP